jgi:hypothetical protein
MGKFAAGFFHSYLDNPNYILLGLFSVNIIVFGILIYCWKAIEFKVDRSAYVFIYLGKVLLSLQLLLEIDITQVLIYL